MVEYAVNQGLDFFGESLDPIMEQIKDGVGDVLVTLIGFCEMNNLTIADCLDHAYGVISKRTGKMVDGLFVKDQ